MRKSPIVFLLILVFLIGLPVDGLAYNAQTTHPSLTKITVEIYNKAFSQNPITTKERQWLMQGAIDEDAGLRKINHFYDPVLNETWKLGGAEKLVPALTAKEWSQNPLIQSFYDSVYASLFASVVKSVVLKQWSPYNPIYWSALRSFVSSPAGSAANHTWQRAIYEYVKGNKESAFESLGHVLHLIQDMSMPSHTRENIAIPFLKSTVDPYEVYTNRDDADFYSFLALQLVGQIPFRRATLNDYFDNLALYSNNYFFSADTIVNSRYSHPEVIFPDVPEIDNGITKFYLLGNDEKKQIFHLARKKLGWRVQSGFNNYTIEDEKVLQDYWTRLAPQAVLNGAGVINLFFQEVEKAKSDPAFMASNERSKIDILLGNISTIFRKIFTKNPNYILVENFYPDSSSLTSVESSSSLAPPEREEEIEQSVPTLLPTSPPQTITIPKVTTTTITKRTTTTTKRTTTTLKPVSLCSFITNYHPLRNEVIINEVAWMGSYNSASDEWIELKNISSKEIDVSNWQLLNKKENIKIILPAATKIQAGQFLLLERTDDNSVPGIKADFIYSGSLTNSIEGLRLFDNNCQLQDEVLADSWPAGDNNSKRTMEREDNFAWHTYQGSSINGIYGTPKRENSQPVINDTSSEDSYSSSSSSDSSQTTTTTTTFPTTTTTTTISTTSTTIPIYSSLLITEIKVAGKDDQDNTLAHDEFVEIYNPNEEDIDLTNWYLQKKTTQGSSFSSLLPKDSLQGKVIPAQGFFLAGHQDSLDISLLDIVWPNDNSVTDDNTIVLKNPSGEVIDKVGWGTASDCEGNCASSPAPGQSIQRKIQEGNFLDTDDNGADFLLQDCPSPKGIESNCSALQTEQSLNADCFHDFSWHPFTADVSRIVLEFDIDNYPFIPATKDTNNIFTATVFYFNQDVPGSEDLDSSAVYLSDTRNVWTVNGDNNGLLVSYPSYYSGLPKLGSIIFASAESYAAGAAIPRKYSYNIASLPDDNHFIIDVRGVSRGGIDSFSENDYVTIGLYGYDSHITSYLRLVGFDNTKYYFQPNKFYHPPFQVENFSVSLAKDSLVDSIVSSSSTNPLVYFSWLPSSDEDIDDLVSYEIHYVFKRTDDDLENNDLTRNSWQWSFSQSVPGSPVWNEANNEFNLNTSLVNLPNLSWPVSAITTMYWAIRAKDPLNLLSPLSSISQLILSPPVSSSE